ncbi:MAG: N-acetylmuramoyl-L-alanine amidase [Rhodothermales bacterium]|nr:N-acetylmuramoyl-L-alanine amidase [Rhodothermales bacterium]MBO6779924.1 N-acetylmuramoyl-L-alanine amidase [Rhodothermales bacterium]
MRLLWGLVLVLVAMPARAQMLDDLDGRLTEPAQRSETAGKRTTLTLTSGALNAPLSGVALEAVSADRALEADIRFQRNGAWGPWLPMRVVRSATGDEFVAGYRGDVLEPAVQFEIRMVAEASIEVGRTVTFDNRQDADGFADDTPFLAPLAGAENGTIIPPPLITRSEWGAGPFVRGNPVPLASPSHDFMTFHHAAGFSATTRDEGIAQVKAIQDLHQDIRGWSDIGYHFVIDRGGRLYQGRPFLNSAGSLNDLPVFARGAHVGGANTGNIGICMLGCYHPPEGGNCQDEITAEALDTYVTLFAFLSERYGVAPSQIRGHRDFSSTACPGDNNYALLPGIRTAVTELLITGNQPIAQATLTAEPGADGVVQVNWEFVADFGVVSHRLERWIDGERDAVLVRGQGAPPATFADAGVQSAEPVNYRLYVTGSDGREQRVASIEVSLDLPVRHTVSEVFPNPASGRVHFRYFMPSRGRVDLALYDTMGRRVAQLADGVQEGERWYAVPYDVGTLAGGVYHYRLVVEGFSGVVFDRAETLVVNR